ncbi:MAG: nucleotidyltransferase domain-containing protein [Chloroflexi bacterium]|nr:nucleotidyltransferase domain-containing protein [Chloroflexota bacterium]
MTHQVYHGPDKLLRALARALFDYFGHNLVSVVLFGSYARGQARPRSDLDLYVIAENLPRRLPDRVAYVHRATNARFERPASIIAECKREFVSGFPSLYLDLALDGIVLYDCDNFMTDKLAQIRRITREAGLRRVRVNGDFAWRWKRQPAPGWSLDWDGLHELTSGSRVSVKSRRGLSARGGRRI